MYIVTIEEADELGTRTGKFVDFKVTDERFISRFIDQAVAALKGEVK